MFTLSRSEVSVKLKLFSILHYLVYYEYIIIDLHISYSLL